MNDRREQSTGKPPWESLTLTETLKIKQAEWVSDIDWKTLAALYLPIIGSRSYALFHALYQSLQPRGFESKIMRHTDITDMLVWSARTYVVARAHLEGIGLLKVYRRKDDYQEPQWLYFLKAPVTPKTFFEDAVLSTLLYREVGEARFKQLRAAFAVKHPRVDTDSWEEVTYSFRDVYRFSPEETMATPKEEESDGQLLSTRKTRAPRHSNNSDFDEQLFKQTLQQRRLPERALNDNVLEIARVIHELYGYDEVTIARLAYACLDFNRQAIDTDQMKQRASELQPAEEKETPQANRPQNSSKVAAPASGQLTEAQQLVAKEAKNYPVIAFVSYLKEARNGYLTNSERQLLTEMVERGRLPQAVINVMAYFYLVELEYPTLFRNTMERTENDWLQRGIKTPEQALYYLQHRESDQVSKKSRRSRPSGYKEVTPEWMDETKHAKQTKKDLADRTDEIQRLLNKDRGSGDA